MILSYAGWTYRPVWFASGTGAGMGGLGTRGYAVSAHVSSLRWAFFSASLNLSISRAHSPRVSLRMDAP